MKTIEKQLKQEIMTLNSKLDDAIHVNLRNENLLQLRSEYIKTLQETDEVNKARLIIAFKELEDLREKVAKGKKFKAATNEELNNLHDTIKNQQFDICTLEHNLKLREEKILKYKHKLKTAGAGEM
jgi:chromosome segregation ATPase